MNRTRWMWRVGAALAAVTGLTLAGAGAQASYPGRPGRIAFGSNGDIWSMRADGSGLTQLTKSPDTDSEPAWSPDGRSIVFVRWLASPVLHLEIFLMRSDGTHVRQLTHLNGVAGNPDWSPDGRQIAFEFSSAHTYQLYVINADGSGTHAITNEDRGALEPRWSPASDQIAFIGFRTNSPQIDVLNLATGHIRQLTHDGANHTYGLDWRPDGAYLAYTTRTPDFRHRVYVMRADGSDPHPVGRAVGTPDFSPVWSPDGTKIAFGAVEGRSTAIYVMGSEGTGLHRVLTVNASSISWQAVPR